MTTQKQTNDSLQKAKEVTWQQKKAAAEATGLALFYCDCTDSQFIAMLQTAEKVKLLYSKAQSRPDRPNGYDAISEQLENVWDILSLQEIKAAAKSHSYKSLRHCIAVMRPGHDALYTAIDALVVTMFSGLHYKCVDPEFLKSIEKLLKNDSDKQYLLEKVAAVPGIARNTLKSVD